MTARLHPVPTSRGRSVVYRRSAVQIHLGGSEWQTSALVDLAPMCHSQDQHEELAIVDLVDHAIVAGSDPPLSGTAYEAGSGRRTRIFREQFDHRLDTTSDAGVELSKLACRRRGKRDGVRHVRPRSALT